MGLLATFTSSEHGLPLTVTDVEGKTVFLSYDAAGDLTERTDRLGRVTSYQYDAMGRKTSMTLPREQGTQKATTYSYDNDGDLLLTANPLGFGERTHLDANRNVSKINLFNTFTLLGGPGVDYLYDLDNHLSVTTNDDDGTLVHQTADFRGNILSRTDEAGHTISYTYDLAGRLLKTTNADLTFTTQTYDELGRLATKTDERTNTTTYGYEPGCGCAQRLTSVTDPLGRTTSMTYDGMGRKTSMTDANQHQTSYVYDLRGHLIETDYADTTTTHDTYDARGRRTATKDQTQQTTLFGYDDEGQLISVTDPLGNVTQYGYDLNGNLTSVTDANEHVTTYAYDDANRKHSRTLPLGMTESFGYDGNNNVVSHTDFRGKTATYGFDQRYPSGPLDVESPGPEPRRTNRDLRVQREQHAVDHDRRQWHDHLHLRHPQPVVDEGDARRDVDVHLRCERQRGQHRLLEHERHLCGVRLGWREPAWVRDRQPPRRRDDCRVHGDWATVEPGATERCRGDVCGYDFLDRVLSMAWKKAAAPAFASWAYSYSPRGQRLTSTEVTGREATYGYDTATRLTSEIITGDPSGAVGNGSLTYSVDPVGNRLSRSFHSGGAGSAVLLVRPERRIDGHGYDLNGNTTSSGGHTYAYDFENRLVSKDGGAVTVVYDGDGNRVAKTAGGVTTKYLVDDLNPTGYLQVMDEVSGGAVQVRYTFGNMLVSQTRNPSDVTCHEFLRLRRPSQYRVPDRPDRRCD